LAWITSRATGNLPFKHHKTSWPSALSWRISTKTPAQAFAPVHCEEKNMEKLKTQRRAIGLLVVFATILTVIVTWNLPESAGD
jgi:hypothetical protein